MKDCLLLVEKIIRNLFQWESCSLSYARRVKLIHSVCYGSINYWLSVKIPASILDRLNQLLSRFLWGGSSTKAFRKVSWNHITIMLSNCGLNLRNLKLLNSAYSCVMSGISPPKKLPMGTLGSSFLLTKSFHMISTNTNSWSIRLWTDHCFKSQVLLSPVENV